MAQDRRCWLFTSSTLENIEVAYQRKLWGFWDRDAVVRGELREKLRSNWRSFIRLYNQVKPFDIVLFQLKDYRIHGVGIVSGKHYDDQTPVWPLETGKNRVFYPWRVDFGLIIYSEKPLARLATRVENYVDGYGIGELGFHEVETVLSRLSERSLKIKL